MNSHYVFHRLRIPLISLFGLQSHIIQFLGNPAIIQTFFPHSQYGFNNFLLIVITQQFSFELFESKWDMTINFTILLPVRL
jgi:uncharacterized membrane protein